jgi:hypothetical protein
VTNQKNRKFSTSDRLSPASVVVLTLPGVLLLGPTPPKIMKDDLRTPKRRQTTLPDTVYVITNHLVTFRDQPKKSKIFDLRPPLTCLCGSTNTPNTHPTDANTTENHERRPTDTKETPNNTPRHFLRHYQPFGDIS